MRRETRDRRRQKEAPGATALPLPPRPQRSHASASPTGRPNPSRRSPKAPWSPRRDAQWAVRVPGPKLKSGPAVINSAPHQGQRTALASAPSGTPGRRHLVSTHGAPACSGVQPQPGPRTAQLSTSAATHLSANLRTLWRSLGPPFRLLKEGPREGDALCLRAALQQLLGGLGTWPSL